ncbi:hypothetical protein JOC77_000537 [Peribacillus deserti]|uniref:Uncharacterized protein n=1 Tax=Peribacillus deserti TaxID=673318 RepID=A0ABS2QD89_9BACI|nr:hypothetical protein [Peribacillus deserti]MBM7691132.1 hypothetical protein [Peribacillus deserti]
MTILGYCFWSAVIIIGGTGYWMERKYKTKAPEKTEFQVQQEEIINRHSQYNSFGGD